MKKIGTCVDFDACFVQEITEYDDLSYGSETCFHNPAIQISEQCFFEMTGTHCKNCFCGFNKGYVFCYDEESDIHHFYK